jgi:hypothetical protein
MLPGEASARGTKAKQRQLHPNPSKERAALLLRRLGHGPLVILSSLSCSKMGSEVVLLRIISTSSLSSDCLARECAPRRSWNPIAKASKRVARASLSYGTCFAALHSGSWSGSLFCLSAVGVSLCHAAAAPRAHRVSLWDQEEPIEEPRN